ncbi:MAG: hypothetical protein DSM106950_28805 [Stigonema ocellatum SAG 48.90 = DSM 106950]|nr:hypothetical protein [Stigonema ocellatum SAG 48.90 = DSM 106950]
MTFLPLTYYQIYRCNEKGQWFHILLPEEPDNWAWRFGLTPKKICTDCFRVADGASGYYLVNLKQKKYYYCGIQLEDVRIQLENLKGLCQRIYNSQRNVEAKPWQEELIDLFSEVEHNLVYVRDRGRFRQFDAVTLAKNILVDVGIDWREIKKRFLKINGGRDGFYIYRTNADEVFFAESLEDAKR